MTAFLLTTAVAALAVVLLMAGTVAWSQRTGRVAVVDVTWGLGFVVVALVGALMGWALGEGEPARRWLLAGLAGAWGFRLAWHVHRRSRGAGEDPRYAALLGDGGLPAAIRKVFVPQGLAIWLVSLPLQAGAVLAVEWWPVLWAGVLLWVAGLAFEAIGDAQLSAYKAQPRESRLPVMDRGLWGWTRHPNYFGDAVVWWGLWLVGGLASGWLPGLLTVIAPIAMTHFLRNVTGAKLLERTMSQRPGWDAYAARVPLFVPRPPSRR